MSNEDKMLQLVLSDNELVSLYEYNAEDFPTVQEALQAENPVVVSVAKIIRGISGEKNIDRSIQREVYNEVFNYLNQNII